MSLLVLSLGISPQTVTRWPLFMNIRSTQNQQRMLLLMFSKQVLLFSFLFQVIDFIEFSTKTFCYSFQEFRFISWFLGVDINCGTYILRHTQSAIKQGKVKEEDLDRALFNLFSVQMRLGLFDGDPRRNLFGKLGPWDVCTPQHKTLALEAARQGIVLLKNDNKFLPLNKNFVTSLAVIGPTATTTKLGGGYSGMLLILEHCNSCIFILLFF